MTTAIFWRFLWKEYRAMRAFWIAMAGLAALAQLAVVKFSGLTHYAAAWTFGFALIFPALYAVACGATMFAAEKEDGTYEFLRSLPVTAWRVLSGKLAFAVASTLLLIAALWWTAALLMKGHPIDRATDLQLWETVGLAAIEGLAWGMFFSLVSKRPLKAAVLAIAAASLGVEFVVRSIAPLRHWDDLFPYVAAVPYRAAIAAVVLLVDVALVPGWMGARAATKRRLLRWPRRAKSEIGLAVQVAELPAARGAIFGRLVWQTWRQSRGMMMLGIGGGLLALLPFEAAFQGELFKADRARTILITAIAVIMGACVFLADQERRSLRFLAERAVRPRSVWIARQATWLSWLVLWALVVHGLWFCLHGGPEFLSAARDTVHRQSWADWANNYFVMKYEHLPPIALSLYLTVGAFACGQLASMFLKSGILAGFIGSVLTLVVYGWAHLMQLYELSWLWFLVPIPAILLFATWLRTPDWIAERNTWRGWPRVGAALAIPLAALLIVVPLYRIHQIPAESPGFDPDQYARSIRPTESARETADMYRRAADAMTWVEYEDWAKLSTAEKKESIEQTNAKAIALLLEAGKRPECSFSDVPYKDRTFDRLAFRLSDLLERSARELESAGKLDEAWSLYMAALRFTDHLRQGTGTWLWLTANSLEERIYRD